MKTRSVVHPRAPARSPAGAALGLALFLAACWALSWGAAWAQAPLAAVRIAHMSPDAPLIDAVIDPGLHFRDIAYGQVSSYLAVPAGNYEIRVYPHRPPLRSQSQDQGPTGGNARSNQDEASLALEPITIVATLRGGSYYTVVLSGFYEPPAGPARAGALSIDVTPADAALVVNGPLGYSSSFTGEQLLSSLEPGAYTVEASREGYKLARYETEIRPGTTTILSVNLQRTDGAEEAPPTATMERSQPSQSQKVELHIYQDDLPGFPAAGAALVRVIHASPVTPALNALAVMPHEDGSGAGGESVAVAEGLAFPNNGDYVQVEGGGYAFEMRAQGSGQILASLPAGALEPGGVYTLFLVGDPADSYLEVIPKVDATRSP